MVAYLSVQSGPDKGKHYVLDPGRPMHVGRGSSCEIMLSDPVSSRFHAVIYFEDGNWQLRDTSSRNGTHVGIHQELGHDKQRYTPASLGGVRQFRQHMGSDAR